MMNDKTEPVPSIDWQNNAEQMMSLRLFRRIGVAIIRRVQSGLCGVRGFGV